MGAPAATRVARRGRRRDPCRHWHARRAGGPLRRWARRHADRRPAGGERCVRFLVLTQYFPPENGAPQVRLAAFARVLRKLGHEVEVATAMPNYPTGRIFEGYRGALYRRDDWDGIPVHRVWLYAAMGAGLKRLLNYASFT